MPLSVVFSEFADCLGTVEGSTQGDKNRLELA